MNHRIAHGNEPKDLRPEHLAALQQGGFFDRLEGGQLVGSAVRDDSMALTAAVQHGAETMTRGALDAESGVMLQCGINGCSFQTTDFYKMTAHKKDKHGIG